MTPADLMRSRIRRYFLTVIGLIGGAFVFLVLLSFVVKGPLALEDKKAAMVVGIAAPFVMIGVVISSWFAVAKYWRCPACEKSVFMTVSWNMSVFASRASRTCPHCNVELFTLKNQRRGFRILLVLMGIAFASGILGAVMQSGAKPKAPVVAKP